MEKSMKYAIITGATKGIGRAIVNTLLEKGYHVAAIARTQTDLDQLSNEDNHIHVYRADVSRKEEIITVAKNILADLGTPTVLVNNAGVFIPGNISTEEDGALEKMMDTNLFSAYHLTRAVLPSMKRQKNGFIFNICSVASLQAYPNGGSYAISKYALLGFSKNLRYELMEDRIRVTSIMPGATMSASWEGVDIDPERLMVASDVAEVVGMTLSLGNNAVVEDVVLRPMLGDL